MSRQDLPTLFGPALGPKDGAAPDSLVILAHGYGSNGEDLINLAAQLQPELPRTQFLAPNAPERCNGAVAGYQWFAISTLDRAERDAGTDAAAPVLDAFIDQKLKEYALTPDRLALIGFSQGTMMSLHVGLRREQPVAGILGYSGSLAAPGRLVAEIRSRPPVQLVHGTHDNVLPFPLMFEAVGALEAAGVPVDKHLSQGVAHGIAPDGIETGTAFLRRVLAA